MNDSKVVRGKRGLSSGVFVWIIRGRSFLPVAEGLDYHGNQNEKCHFQADVVSWGQISKFLGCVITWYTQQRHAISTNELNEDNRYFNYFTRCPLSETRDHSFYQSIHKTMTRIVSIDTHRHTVIFTCTFNRSLPIHLIGHFQEILLLVRTM